MLKLRLVDSRLGLRNSSARIPFRYGGACLTRCPQAVLEATIECEGRALVGYSGDCLPPGWFDKSPGKSFRQQVDEMLAAISLAQNAFAEAFSRPEPFFPSWRLAHRQTILAANERGFPSLLASFATSLLERAIIDAVCRRRQVSFARAVRENVLGIIPEEVHPALAGFRPQDWLPDEPLTETFVRHTVGLADPLTECEMPEGEKLHDGRPQALEEYLRVSGIRYLKIKVSNRLEHDLARLATIADLVERKRGADYAITLDGNEQYKSAHEFDELIGRLASSKELATLWRNTLAIEQPLDRGIALAADQTGGIRKLGEIKPVIVDESDGDLQSYAQAIELGYRGVSSKNCKGPIKSILNAGLTWRLNGKRKPNELVDPRYLMTGEDLCAVGVIPVQSDLCLTATLGLTHVERNGHHFQPGLAYLSEREQEAALAAHPDLYETIGGVVSLRLVDGKLRTASLQCVGFGFASLPETTRWHSPSEWSFDSLGLPD